MADNNCCLALFNYPAATIIISRRKSWREENRAAWTGAASRACGARSGRRDTLGGRCRPPEPPASFFRSDFCQFLGGSVGGCTGKHVARMELSCGS